jgi:uncharacterized protein YjbJ (UPF0337 family)
MSAMRQLLRGLLANRPVSPAERPSGVFVEDNQRRNAMGEFTDKMKGAANQAAGNLKQRSANERVREEGAAQELKGDGQEVKGKIKGVINKL